MGRYKDFNPGSTRMQLLQALTQLGLLPYTSLKYFSPNLETIRRMVRLMIAEGMLVQKKTPTHQKYYILKNTNTIKAELLNPIPSEWIETYQSPELQECRSKATKMGECDRVLYSVDACIFAYYAGAQPYAMERTEFVHCKSAQDLAGNYYPSLECKQMLRNSTHPLDTATYGQVKGSRIAGLYVSHDQQPYMFYTLNRHNLTFDNYEYTMKDHLLRSPGMMEISRNTRASGVLLYQHSQSLLEVMTASIHAYDTGSHSLSGNHHHMLDMKHIFYNKVYALPATYEGVQLMRIMSHKGWEQRVASIIVFHSNVEFDNEDYDDCVDCGDAIYTTLIFCIPDLRKLYHYLLYPLNVDENKHVGQVIFCFDFQVPFISKFAFEGNNVELKPITESFAEFLDEYQERYGEI